jgi:hypothetical protein
MATNSWLLTVSILVEQDAKFAAILGGCKHVEEQLREVLVSAVTNYLATRPDVVVEWESLTSTPLDNRPGVDRCAICNRWMFDAENVTLFTVTAICRGAIVDGQYLCDEHLPKDHPLAF